MVQPEYDDDQVGQPGVSRAALVLSGLALAVTASLVIGSLTDPGINGAGTTTTSTIAEIRPPLDPEDFSVAAIETGGPLDWQQVMVAEDMWPLGVAEHEGRSYLFATRPDLSAGIRQDGGLVGWASVDGGSWQELGELIDPSYLVNRVVPTPGGLVAIGRGADGETPMVWVARTGLDWLPYELPLNDAPAGSRSLSHATTTGGTVVAVGQVGVDPVKILSDHLPETLTLEHLDRYSVGWEGPPWTLLVHGPMGLVAHRFSAEDLNITEERLSALLSPFDTPATRLWATTDGESWRTSTLEVWGFEDLFTHADGTLIATAYGYSDLELLASNDGLSWERLAEDTDFGAIAKWGDSMIAVDRGVVPELELSRDGLHWAALGVGDLFPELGVVRGLHWNVEHLAAGQAGVAFIAEGWVDSGESFEPDPVVLELEESRLSINEWTGFVDLDIGDQTFKWAMYTEATVEDIRVDLEAETVAFHHPGTGEHLLTVTFDEMERAAAARAASNGFSSPRVARHGWMSGERIAALVFSQDAAEWVVQDLSSVIGADQGIVGLATVDSGVIVVTAEDPIFYGSWPASPRTVPSFQVWLGILPQP